MSRGREQLCHDLLIFPCNGNGLEALDCLGESFRCLGFIDDTPEKQRDGAYGYEVFNRDALTRFEHAKVLAVPGGPHSYHLRQEIITGLQIAPERFATVIHPHASVSTRAQIGHNVLIMAGVVITSNAVLGNHVCVLPNSVVHHDAVVNDWTLIGSNVTVAGHAKVGTSCYIGSGTRIMNGIEVGNGALAGLGSNVIRNVAAGDRVVGNPARPLPRQ